MAVRLAAVVAVPAAAAAAAAAADVIVAASVGAEEVPVGLVEAEALTAYELDSKRAESWSVEEAVVAAAAAVAVAAAVAPQPEEQEGRQLQALS